MNALSSVRARLTAWNVGVVAVVLVLSGAAVRYFVEANLIAAADRELHRRTQFLVDRFRRPFPPGPRRDLPFRPPGGGPHGERREGPRPYRGPQSPFPARVLDPSGRNPFDGQHIVPWHASALARSLAGETVYVTIDAGGEPLRLISRPLVRDGAIQAVIQEPAPLAATLEAVDQLTRTLLLLIPMALALAGLGGGFLTGRALRPVREITRAASTIEAENLSERLPVQGRDEFARLTGVLNGMLERLETAFERQKRFTGDASHELRTPLATIKATSSLAREDEWGAEACQKAMASIEGAADRASRIVDDLLLLARADNQRLVVATRPVLVGQVLDQARRETLAAADGERAPVVLDLPAGTPLAVSGDPDHLTGLFVNLLENALRHTPPPGRVTVAARAEGERVVVTVADTGEGIPAVHLPHLGERFYRVDAARARSSGGAGLGLALCKSIVEAHHGELEIDSEPGRGTVVTVTLPRA